MLLESRLKIVRDLYLEHPAPWVVAFSGGKDSTAVLQLIWLAIAQVPARERSKRIHVAYVDTGMEYPLYSEQLKKTFRNIRKSATTQEMPFKVRILRPALKHRYFVSVIGRGYAPPTHWFRWCTKGMRIRPMTQLLKQMAPNGQQLLLALGLRRDESHARRATLDKYASSKHFLGRYGGLAQVTAFTPIEDFTIDEVWQFLMQTKCPWGDNNRRLARIYSLASGGECPSYSLDKSMTPSCGGSRFGCWTCTVVRKDRAGEGLADEDVNYEGLLEFRNWLAAIRYDPQRRWRVRRNGKPGPGPLTLATRREILDKLLVLQDKTGFSLISRRELMEIQKSWTADGDRHDSALMRAP